MIIELHSTQLSQLIHRFYITCKAYAMMEYDTGNKGTVFESHYILAPVLCSSTLYAFQPLPNISFTGRC